MQVCKDKHSPNFYILCTATLMPDYSDSGRKGSRKKHPYIFVATSTYQLLNWSFHGNPLIEMQPHSSSMYRNWHFIPCRQVLSPGFFIPPPLDETNSNRSENQCSCSCSIISCLAGGDQREPNTSLWRILPGLLCGILFLANQTSVNVAVLVALPKKQYF